MTLLRVAPLVTSTTAISFSYDQYLFHRSLLAPQHRQKANEILPSYFTVWFWRGLCTILTVYPLSIATGVTNFYSKPNGAYPWYVAGTALASAHFLFVPLVAYPVKAITDDDSKEESSKDFQKWLNVHSIRSLLVDLPSWICFGIETLKSFKSE